MSKNKKKRKPRKLKDKLVHHEKKVEIEKGKKYHLHDILVFLYQN